MTRNDNTENLGTVLEHGALRGACLNRGFPSKGFRVSGFPSKGTRMTNLEQFKQPRPDCRWQCLLLGAARFDLHSWLSGLLFELKSVQGVPCHMYACGSIRQILVHCGAEPASNLANDSCLRLLAARRPCPRGSGHRRGRQEQPPKW